MRFRLDKAIGDVCVKTVRKAAADLAGGAPRAPHRSRDKGPIGGRLLSALRSGAKIVRRERWGAVIQWSALGQSFMFLNRGTRRQKARPVTLAPDERELRDVVAEEAAKHFEQRERKRGRR